MGVRARRADLARPARRRLGGAVRVNITDSRAALEASRRRVLASVGEAETILTQATGLAWWPRGRSLPRPGTLCATSRRPTPEPGPTLAGSPLTIPRARSRRS